MMEPTEYNVEVEDSSQETEERDPTVDQYVRLPYLMGRIELPLPASVNADEAALKE